MRLIEKRGDPNCLEPDSYHVSKRPKRWAQRRRPSKLGDRKSTLGSLPQSRSRFKCRFPPLFQMVFYHLEPARFSRNSSAPGHQNPDAGHNVACPGDTLHANFTTAYKGDRRLNNLSEIFLKRASAGYARGPGDTANLPRSAAAFTSSFNQLSSRHNTRADFPFTFESPEN